MSDGAKVVTTVSLGGLRIVNTARKIDAHGAYEWVNTLENTGDEPTPIISELWDCRCTFQLPHEEPRRWTAMFPDRKTATKIYAPTGSTWSAEEFYSDSDQLVGNRRIHHICVGESKDYTTSGGRSSESQAPFFNVHKNGHGVIAAVGWTGQWRCRMTHGAADITIRSGIDEGAEYVLEDLDGGETVLTGRELANLRLTIDTPRTAKIYIYRKNKLHKRKTAAPGI